MATCTVQPDEYPVTVDEVKSYLHVDGEDEDADFARWIAAATKELQTYTRRQFVTASYRQYLDAFPAESYIDLPITPLADVTAVTYTDTDGVSQTLDSSTYLVETDTDAPGSIVLAYDQTWPAARDCSRAVQIDYTAGYGAAGDVPADAKLAIMMLVGHWYLNREAAGGTMQPVPMGYKQLADSLRVEA